jgi:hypothetical protein
MGKNIVIILLGLFSFNILANNFDKAIIKKYNCSGIAPTCQKNVCTTNPLCKVYSNQNMCLLSSEIPKELQNLSYAIYPTQVDKYNTARFNYNKRFNIYPHAIFRPENASQVAYIVSIMRKYNLDFAIRSGGHCYGPGSLSIGYVIDMSNFNSIIPNIEKQEVFIGSGCLLGNVIQSLASINYAIPTGECSSVGVTGLSLGGGIGLLARAFGLTADSIKSITMIDAKSQIIEVSATNQYSDLFWAMCGAGGGSYGIVLGLTFKMHYVPKATFVKLIFDWDATNLFELFQTWQQWIKTIPTDISTQFNFIYRSGKLSISINSLRPGTKSFDQWKIFKKFNPMINITSGSYLSCAEKFASNYTQPFSKARSKFIFDPLSNSAIQVVIDYFNELLVNKMPFLIFIEFGACGGQLAKGHNSYFPRNAFIYSFQFIYWDLETQTNEALTSINKFYNNFAPFTSPYSYANLIDYELGNTFLNAYYGTHVKRLIKIKNKYDPLNIFKWRQSIPLSR